MKKLLFIATPVYEMIHYRYVSSLVNTWASLYGKYDLGWSVAPSVLIHKNRNLLIQEAIKNNADYLLFIDADIVWETKDVDKVLEFDRDVVSGIYGSRRPLQGVEHAPVVFRYNDNKMSVIKDIPSTPFKADGVGMGFCLLKRNVIDKMVELIPKIGYPFDYIDIKDIGAKTDGLSNTVGEDLSFCYKLQKAGFDIWVHPEVRVKHLTTEMIV